MQLLEYQLRQARPELDGRLVLILSLRSSPSTGRIPRSHADPQGAEIGYREGVPWIPIVVAPRGVEVLSEPQDKPMIQTATGLQVGA